MSTQARKARETQQREQLILDAGRRLLLEGGYLGLSMDRIAEAIEYSKGTVYQHFSSKEDLIAGMILQAFDRRLELFERAATFSGRPRERLLALAEADELFFRLYPDHITAQQVIMLSSLAAKASPARQRAVAAGRSRLIGIVTGVFRDGIAQGDLDLPGSYRVEDLTFGLWALFFGSQALSATPVAAGFLGVRDTLEAARRTSYFLLDGLGWHPLTHEWDYDGTLARIRAELFPEERRRVDAGGNRAENLDRCS